MTLPNRKDEKPASTTGGMSGGPFLLDPIVPPVISGLSRTMPPLTERPFAKRAL